MRVLGRCSHKPVWSKADANARYSTLCGLNSDLAGGPRRASYGSRHFHSITSSARASSDGGRGQTRKCHPAHSQRSCFHRTSFAANFCGRVLLQILPANPSPAQSICPSRSAAKNRAAYGTRRYFFSAGRPYIPTRVALASVWKCSSNPTSAADTLWSLAYCSFSSSTANTVKM
jgi:hypothetical protein